GGHLQPRAGRRRGLRHRRRRGREDSAQGRPGHHALQPAGHQQDRSGAPRGRGPLGDGARRAPDAGQPALGVHQPPHGRGRRHDPRVDPARAVAQRQDGVNPTAPLAPARVGRDGMLRLRFERRGSATVVAGCRYTLPLQTLAPVALDDPAAVVSILNPTGGLVGGDRLSMEVEATAGAHAALPTPRATRVYRAEGAAATQSVRISIGPQAAVEWVPDHTIPFAGSAFRQTLDVEMDENAVLILVDAFSAGRLGRGEAWQFGILGSAVPVRDGNGRVLFGPRPRWGLVEGQVQAPGWARWRRIEPDF